VIEEPFLLVIGLWLLEAEVRGKCQRSGIEAQAGLEVKTKAVKTWSCRAWYERTRMGMCRRGERNQECENGL
jgi:hypothetical protein